MMIKKFSLLFLFVFPLLAVAQINQKDANGKKHGQWIGNHENSTQKAYEGTFDHGKRTGLFYFYYPNGKLKAAMLFSKNGTYAKAEMYFEDGTLIGKGNYVNEKKDSVWTYYGGTGYVRKTETWKNGKLDGKTTIYFEPQPGDTKMRVLQYFTYKDSILNGEFAEYYLNGKRKLLGNYLDGNMDGKVIEFYEDSGRKMVVKNYKYAVRHGLWEYFEENGTLIKRRYFDKNRELEGEVLKLKLAEIDGKSGN